MSKDEPIDLDDTPAEEGISKADAAERLEQDPEEVPNRTDTRARADEQHKD